MVERAESVDRGINVLSESQLTPTSDKSCRVQVVIRQQERVAGVPENKNDQLT
jgi:hypothetical protein